MYTIVDGVRRAVAAREAGNKTILATILHEGKTVATQRVPLDELMSSKEMIIRNYRYQRIERGLSEGAEIPAIIVTQYVPFEISELTPLQAVALVAE